MPLSSAVARTGTVVATAALVACSTAGPAAEPGAAPAAVPSLVATPSDPSLRAGFDLYQEHCAACHGTRGEGDPDWKIPLDDGSLKPPPHDSSGHTWHHSDEELLRIIREGGVIYMPQSKMPGYAEVLTEAEMRAVLDYIRSLWGPQERAYQAERSLPEGEPPR